MATDTANCLRVYGDPSTVKFQGTWLVRHPIPATVLPHFPPYPGVPHVTAIYMNKFACASLDAVLLELVATGLIKELHSYDGCLNLRKKRGMNEYSIHSWGLALDFDQAQAPLGSQAPHFTQAFLQVWRDHDWDCGADWPGRRDEMHFQYTKKFPV